MNKPEAASTTERGTVKAGCCGPEGTHDHVIPSPAHSAQDDRPAVSKSGAPAKAADKQKSGNKSGCCCS